MVRRDGINLVKVGIEDLDYLIVRIHEYSENFIFLFKRCFEISDDGLFYFLTDIFCSYKN